MSVLQLEDGRVLNDQGRMLNRIYSCSVYVV